ncbi:cytochrome b/b6 domain-containing protein [Photobacterium sp. MCCC 1A19761]|uniref:cytochrome b/b6 domain-containing protein n=1 Tax=Photobacterium sp. MCCC 1A19761 TaxID=3115000 RepID=UPI00307F6641
MASVYVWDKVVRLTHWTVAVLFLSNFFLLEEGSELHEWAGYLILVAIGVRLVWGMMTASHARLSAFKPSVPKAIAHIREVFREKRDDHVGHNPAGAVMIWVMWSLIILTALSGWSMEEKVFGNKDLMEEIHEFLANLTMIAVTLHVGAVVLMTKVTHKPYLQGMLPRRRADK